MEKKRSSKKEKKKRRAIKVPAYQADEVLGNWIK